MSLHFPKEKRITSSIVEAYIQGMYDLYIELGGDTHCKIYDPITIEGNIAHSYVFEFNDGGRHHSFGKLEDLMEMARKEIARSIKNDL